MTAPLDRKRGLLLVVGLAAVAVIGFAVGRSSGSEESTSDLEPASVDSSVAIDGVADAGSAPDLRAAPRPPEPVATTDEATTDEASGTTTPAPAVTPAPTPAPAPAPEPEPAPSEPAPSEPSPSEPAPPQPAPEPDPPVSG